MVVVLLGKALFALRASADFAVADDGSAADALVVDGAVIVGPAGVVVFAVCLLCAIDNSSAVDAFPPLLLGNDNDEQLDPIEDLLDPLPLLTPAVVGLGILSSCIFYMLLLQNIKLSELLIN